MLGQEVAGLNTATPYLAADKMSLQYSSVPGNLSVGSETVVLARGAAGINVVLLALLPKSQQLQEPCGLNDRFVGWIQPAGHLFDASDLVCPGLYCKLLDFTHLLRHEAQYLAFDYRTISRNVELSIFPL